MRIAASWLGLQILGLAIVGSAQPSTQADSNAVQEHLAHEGVSHDAKGDSPMAPGSLVRRELMLESKQKQGHADEAMDVESFGNQQAHLTLAYPHNPGSLQEGNRGDGKARTRAEDDSFGRRGSRGQGMQHQDKMAKGHAEFIDTSGQMHATHKLGNVDCGTHTAVSCSACPTTAADGTTTSFQGEDSCTGDCTYSGGACHEAGGSSQEAFDKMMAAESSGHPLVQVTTQVPDLKNPNMTSYDNETINAAAEAALKEEEREDEAKEHKGKKFSWRKFWLVVVIIMSVILGICCICSITAICTYQQVAPPAKKVEEVEDEPEGDDAEVAEEEED